MVRERERVPDEAFRDWSVSVAEGNPFFLRELTTYWLQTGTAYQVPTIRIAETSQTFQRGKSSI